MRTGVLKVRIGSRWQVVEEGSAEDVRVGEVVGSGVRAGTRPGPTGGGVAGEVSEEEADDLQELDEEDRQLLQAARRRDEEDAGMRERVAEDVEGLMGNGVRMNPWLGAYCRTGGGSGGGSQAGGVAAAQGSCGGGSAAAHVETAGDGGSERTAEGRGEEGGGAARGEEGEVRWRYEGMRVELWGEQRARVGDRV